MHYFVRASARAGKKRWAVWDVINVVARFDTEKEAQDDAKLRNKRERDHKFRMDRRAAR